jgi:hypothetical protein
MEVADLRGAKADTGKVAADTGALANTMSTIVMAVIG